MRALRVLGPVCLLALAALPAAALVAPPEPAKQSLVIERRLPAGRSVMLDPTSATPLSAAARKFVGRHGGQWSFRIDSRTGRVELVQGSGIQLVPEVREVTVEEATALATQFVRDNATLLVPQRGLLVPDPETSSIREDGRLISVYFRWAVDGVPVEDARVFVRLNSGNLTQFGSMLVGSIATDTKPMLDERAAWQALLTYSGDTEIAQARGAQLILQPEETLGGALGYRLVWKLTYRIFAQLETWEGRVDARTGEVVGFRDTNRYMQVVGGVYPRTVFEANETRAPMPFADVWVDGAVVVTDVAGGASFPGGEVQAALSGKFHRANCESCSEPVQPWVQHDAGSGFVDFGSGGLDEVGNGWSTPADRNTVFHLNQVQRIARKWLPGEPWFSSRPYFTANTNIQDTCNALFGGDAIYMFRSGGGCNNTGEISDVIYHEYGHGVDSFTQPGDGATGEATGDITSMHLTHGAEVGPGFQTDGDPVRDLDKNTTSKGLLTVGNIAGKCNGGGGPLGFEVHCEGEIYGQTSWDLAQALVTKHGHFTGWRTSERIFFTALPDSGIYLPNQALSIYDAYLQADDDDGNLANGTPNAPEIFAAFDLHGIAGAAVPGSPACTRPAQPVLTVTPQCDAFELSWPGVAGADHYEVLRTELREDMAGFPVAELPGGATSFVDTEVVPGVDYWYSVMAVDAAGCESTVESPLLGRLPAQPILTVSAATPDDEPMGNRSGFADPAEDVDVTVSLGNFGEIDAAGVSGTVVPITAGVTMLEDVSSWPAIPTEQVAANLDPIRFHIDESQVDCGDVVRLRVDPDEASGCAAAESYIDVRVGEPVTLHFDDFESNLGWAPDDVNSTATNGAWTRGAPFATEYQAGSDASADGTQCWFTGVATDNTGDVDGGVQILVSPVFDLTAQIAVDYSYARWYAHSEPGVDPTDFFLAEASDDGGSTWVALETIDHTLAAAGWFRARHRLDDYIALTNQVRFRFQVSDGAATGGTQVEAAVDDIRLETYQCDLTPACFIEPTFAGLAAASAGTSCGEVDLVWSPGSSNCINATIGYNVYRSTDPDFVPGPATLVAAGLTGSSFTDVLLAPAETLYYVVRADDSRSGEDSNIVRLQATAPAAPDIRGPIFGGIDSAVPGSICREAVLAWSPGLESCSGPVHYDVYRSTDPDFVPGPADLVGTTLDLSFTDFTVLPATAYTYVVRARDALGNSDTNTVHLTATSKALDRTIVATTFEASGSGWTVVAPNTATAGNWEWGDPWATAYQPENDVTATGVNCWITETLPTPSNGDVDGGVTTLLSAQYSLSTAVAPGVRYSRWFTNDRGSNPGEPTDDFVAAVSNNNGTTWTELERIGAGTPLAWVPVSLPVTVTGTNQMRFRFTAADAGVGGSIVEAGIDDFSLVDIGQGCQLTVCGPTPINSCEFTQIAKSGNDVVLSWPAANQGTRRAVIYHVTGCGEAIQLGSTTGSSFVHKDALLSSDAFNYRYTFVAACGKETPIDACVTTACE